MDSFNSGYSGAYTGKIIDENMTIIDNTPIHVDLLDVLKYKCKVYFLLNRMHWQDIL
jgi:hypothetical protein